MERESLAGIRIRVCKVEGNCSVYKGGEVITIDGPEIDMRRSDRICIHALAPILHYVVALREGVDPKVLGLSKGGKDDQKAAYIACVDPGPPFTDGGRVIFEMTRIDDQNL